MSSNYQKANKRAERFERHQDEKKEEREKMAEYRPDFAKSPKDTDDEASANERRKRINQGT